jgi:hypothetical protein
MSIGSKARRDARKKQTRPAGKRPPASIRPHAHLRDPQDQIVGGAGLRGSEWVLVMAGEVLAGTDSAAMVLAMLNHAAALRREAGETVRLTYSDFLRDAATAEAVAEGKTLEELLAALEEERIEHARAKLAASGRVQ